MKPRLLGNQKIIAKAVLEKERFFYEEQYQYYFFDNQSRFPLQFLIRRSLRSRLIPGFSLQSGLEFPAFCPFNHNKTAHIKKYYFLNIFCLLHDKNSENIFLTAKETKVILK